MILHQTFSSLTQVIWSRETKLSKDFEPLAFDDTRLVSNQRINANRLIVSKKPHDQIEWTLSIDNLELSDSNNYICQLNSWPYDVYWLKRFMLNVYGNDWKFSISVHRAKSFSFSSQQFKDSPSIFIGWPFGYVPEIDTFSFSGLVGLYKFSKSVIFFTPFYSRINIRLKDEPNFTITENKYFLANGNFL